MLKFLSDVPILVLFYRRTLASPGGRRRFLPIRCTLLCTPGMDVNLWGESSLYMNLANVVDTLAKVLTGGKGVSVRDCLKV